jgi:hypothetical protein
VAEDLLYDPDMDALLNEERPDGRRQGALRRGFATDRPPAEGNLCRGLRSVDVIPLDADGSWVWKQARLPSAGPDGGSGDHTGGFLYEAGSY